MMKLATIAAALLLSVEANAAKVGRNRKVNIYSSKSEFGRETVDPYLGFPDEREQRSLQEGSVALEMSMPAATGSVALEMSMPAASGSVAIGSVALEMSMPAATGSVAIGSVALEMSMPTAIGSMAGLSLPAGEGGFGANAVIAAAESADSSSAMTMGHSAAVATIVSAIAGVAALV
jgi:hypothetical protein